MIEPLRENLELFDEGSEKGVRCARCHHGLAPDGDDWRDGCLKRRSAPEKVGPLFAVLSGKFVFEQLYCPSCLVLLNTEIVQEDG